MLSILITPVSSKGSHTDLDPATGLNLYVDTTPLPLTIEARGQGASSTPASAAHPSHPLILQVL